MQRFRRQIRGICFQFAGPLCKIARVARAAHTVEAAVPMRVDEAGDYDLIGKIQPLVGLFPCGGALRARPGPRDGVAPHQHGGSGNVGLVFVRSEQMRAIDSCQHCGASCAKWQATKWPGAICRNAGASVLQRSHACAHRVWKRHPDGGWIGLGTSPCRTTLWRRSASSICGIAERSAFV